MYTAFVKLLNMSAASGVLIAVVIALRFLLRRIPKKYICILWAIVALRLACPVSISSPVSAYNYLGSGAESSGQVEYIHYNGKSEKPKAELTIPLPTEPVGESTPAAEPAVKDVYIPTMMGIWAAGVAAMLAYAAVSYWRVRMQVRESIPRDGRQYRQKIYLCDHIPSPFILGIIRPKIYLPSNLDGQQQRSVIAHERAHIARLDHLWKPLGFLLLSVHWFNPLVWVGYGLLCRDIEMACDEKVIEKMSPEQKQIYSTVLLTCSMPRKAITACPLAFGESGVKERVRGILNYRRPSFWVVLVSVLLCLILAVSFLSNPLRTEDYLRLREEGMTASQRYTYSFAMRTGRTVKRPVLTAELWQKGTLMQIERRALSNDSDSLSVNLMWAVRSDGTISECRVQAATIDNAYGSDLDVTFALPEGATLGTMYPWHGAKDIPLTAEKEILLAAAVFDCGNGYFLFDFDNEDYAANAEALQKMDCALVVRADFGEVTSADPGYDAYWEALRQAGLIHQENGEELFYEHLPAEYVGVSQEELDEWNGITHQSAQLLPDGSAIYKMNREQYEYQLNELAVRIERNCDGLPKSAYFREFLTSITHNADFTEYTVTVKNGNVIDFDAEEISDYLEITARQYSLYTTGNPDRPITVRYVDPAGNPAAPASPNYRLYFGSEGVNTFMVQYGGSSFGYANTLGMLFPAGDSRSLHVLNGREDLKDVQIVVRDVNEQILWQHAFTGEETFPWEENGWRVEQTGTAQSSDWREESPIPEKLVDFLSPTRVEYRDNSMIDKASKGSQMTLEELFLSESWTEQPIPEGVTGPGTMRRGLTLYAENGTFLVISYDVDALCIFNINGDCIARYVGSYTGEKMVDLLWDWTMEQYHTGAAWMVGQTLTQAAPRGMLSVLLHPTTALDIDGMGAVTPENQEEWISAWNAVLSSPADGAQNAGADTYHGAFLFYQDEYLELHRNEAGLFLRKLGTDAAYSAEASQPLVKLLEPIMQELDYAPLKPAQLQGIQYANLWLDGMQYSIPQGDPRLSRLEAMLASGQPMMGMSACWFTSLLRIGLPSGDFKTISVATDDCGVYLSDGVCYEFANDNAALYQLFGVTTPSAG